MSRKREEPLGSMQSHDSRLFIYALRDKRPEPSLRFSSSLTLTFRTRSHLVTGQSINVMNVHELGSAYEGKFSKWLISVLSYKTRSKPSVANDTRLLVTPGCLVEIRI